MSRFTTSAGTVYEDGHRIDLAEALDKSGKWGLAAIRCEQAGDRGRARVFARDSLAIHAVHERAYCYRRAAGWRNPYDADTATLSDQLKASLEACGAIKKEFGQWG